MNWCWPIWLLRWIPLFVTLPGHNEIATAQSSSIKKQRRIYNNSQRQSYNKATHYTTQDKSHLDRRDTRYRLSREQDKCWVTVIALSIKKLMDIYLNYLKRTNKSPSQSSDWLINQFYFQLLLHFLVPSHPSELSHVLFSKN